MNSNDSGPKVSRRYPLGERVLVLLIAVAAFGYFFYRVFHPWDPWPDATFWPRVGEATFAGLFLLWAAGFVLSPLIFGGDPGQPQKAGPSEQPMPPDENGTTQDHHE